MTDVYFDVSADDFDEATYRAPYLLLESKRDDLKDMFVVAHLFAPVLEQHNLTVGADVQFSLTDIARVQSGEVQMGKRITFTFKDDATALVFKLSHLRGAL